MTRNQFQEDWNNLKKYMKTEDREEEYLRRSRASLQNAQNGLQRAPQSPEALVVDSHQTIQVQSAEENRRSLDNSLLLKESSWAQSRSWKN